MSTDNQPPLKPLLEPLRAKRQGLRVATAVTAGFCMGLVFSVPLPFLAPMFATQFLLVSRSPPTLRQGVATVLMIILSGALLVVFTSLLRERPWVLLPLLWSFYLTCFVAQGKQLGGAGPALMLVIGVTVPLLDILQRDLGESIVLLLTKSISLGVLLAWGVHAVFPDPTGESPEARTTLPRKRPLVIRQSMASAAILVTMVALCLSDPRLTTAIVIPITVASLLGQCELGMGSRAALGIVIVNLLGGVVASAAFTLFELHSTLWLVALILLLVSLLFSGRAVLGGSAGQVFGGGLMTFLILFGLGVSPLPDTASALFSTRIIYVLVAVAYTLGLTALVWPRPRADATLKSTTN